LVLASVLAIWHGRTPYRSEQSRKTHVGGFVEEVTTTTPFDMTMLSKLG
jgi:phosphoketolase